LVVDDDANRFNGCNFCDVFTCTDRIPDFETVDIDGCDDKDVGVTRGTSGGLYRFSLLANLDFFIAVNDNDNDAATDDDVSIFDDVDDDEIHNLSIFLFCLLVLLLLPVLLLLLLLLLTRLL